MKRVKPDHWLRLTVVLPILLIGSLLDGCGPKKLGPLDYPPGVTPGGQGGPGAGKATKAPGGPYGRSSMPSGATATGSGY